MAVLHKWRGFWNIFAFERAAEPTNAMPYVSPLEPDSLMKFGSDYELHPLTLAQLDELWQLDKRCFVNGEAYSRHTLEYLLGEPNGVSYRAVLPNGAMIGFVIAMHEKDGTGHITTIGVAPEYRRRGLAYRLLEKTEDAFRKRGVSLMRLEVRTANAPAQKLYQRSGYIIMQRLARYYANGGDGLLMVKSLI